MNDTSSDYDPFPSHRTQFADPPRGMHICTTAPEYPVQPLHTKSLEPLAVVFNGVNWDRHYRPEGPFIGGCEPPSDTLSADVREIDAVFPFDDGELSPEILAAAINQCRIDTLRLGRGNNRPAENEHRQAIEALLAELDMPGLRKLTVQTVSPGDLECIWSFLRSSRCPDVEAVTIEMPSHEMECADSTTAAMNEIVELRPKLIFLDTEQSNSIAGTESEDDDEAPWIRKGDFFLWDNGKFDSRRMAYIHITRERRKQAKAAHTAAAQILPTARRLANALPVLARGEDGNGGADGGGARGGAGDSKDARPSLFSLPHNVVERILQCCADHPNALSESLFTSLMDAARDRDGELGLTRLARDRKRDERDHDAWRLGEFGRPQLWRWDMANWWSRIGITGRPLTELGAY